MGVEISYSLCVRRYGRHLNFNSLQELKNSLLEYFSESEKDIVEKLTTFRPDELVDGIAVHSWRDFEVSMYRSVS